MNFVHQRLVSNATSNRQDGKMRPLQFGFYSIRNWYRKPKLTKKIQFPRCPFELPANQHSQSSPNGSNRQCWLAGNSKGHCGKWEFFLLILVFDINFCCYKSIIGEDAFFLHLKLNCVQFCIHNLYISMYCMCNHNMYNCLPTKNPYFRA